MPLKGYKQTEEHRKKINSVKIGSKRSEETRKKMSIANKGRVPWNKGKKVDYFPFKGKKHTKEWCEMMSKKMMGHVSATKGTKFSDETRALMSKIAKGKRHHRKGVDHPNWKGGIDSINIKIRTSYEYQQWRSDVYTRDNYSCQECGDNKGGNLEAHHIEPLTYLIEKYNIENMLQALNCVELWNINNGITLCKDCHKKTDTYGMRVKKYKKDS